MPAKILKILLLICLALPTMAFGSEARSPVIYHFMDRPFMELLGYIEGPDGYDEITGFTKREPIKPISQMTINEVLDYQRMLRQHNTKSSAVGRYQYVYKTLEYVTRAYDIDRNQLFDAKMQDSLARIEMERCGFYDPHMKTSELGDCLAHVWAALPLLTGPKRGQSRYRATGINAAKTTPEIFEAILNNRFYTREFMRKNKSDGFSSVHITTAKYPG